MANSVTAKELMTFNSRSDLGRVVVNPPGRFSLKLHDTLPMYLCCGRAFLTSECYEKHRAEVEDHGKPIDFSKVRTALHDRSSAEFWRSRKAKSAKNAEDDSDDENAEDKCNNEEDSGNTERSPEQSGSTSNEIRSVPGGRPYKMCTDCNMWMPGTNIIRHTRVCHNPKNEFPCRYCCCRLSTAYGRMVHEVKVHKASSTLTNTRKLKALVATHQKKLLKLPVLTKQPAIADISISKKYFKLPSGMYKCTICNKEFTNMATARDHINIHVGAKPHKCPRCHLRFTHKSNIHRHLRTSHVKDGQFPCPLKCGCVMQTRTGLSVHVTICRGMIIPPKPKGEIKRPAPLKPSEIPVQQTKDSTISDEVKKAQIGPGLFHCNLCNKNITCSGNFRDHLNSHAGIRPHKCPLCYMTFTFKSNIKRHIQTCHVSNGRFKCPMKCGCIMSSKKCLHSHLNSCKRKFKARAIAANDTKKLTDIKIKVEPTSPGKQPLFTQPSQRFVNLPVLKTAPSDPLAKFQCDECGKTVSCARNLRNHKLIHSGVRPHKCELCGLAFRAIESLRKHRSKSHIPTGAYRCPECPCQFRQQQGLAMHTSVHHTKTWNRKTESQQDTYYAHTSPLQPPKQMPKLTRKPMHLNGITKAPAIQQKMKTFSSEGVNKFQCNICGKVLQSSITLRQHRSIHTGEKPFLCKLCGYRFRLGSTLYEHNKNSHRGGSYACDKCSCQFHTDLGLSRHYSVFHGGINTNSSSLLKKKVSDIKRKALQLAAGTTSSSTLQNVNFGMRDRPLQLVSTTKERRTLNVGSRQYHPYLPDRRVEIKREIDSGPNFTCGHCGLVLDSIQELSDHQRAHTKQEVEENSEDDDYQEMPLLVEMHEQDEDVPVATETSKKSNWPVPCDLCGCQIHSNSHLKRHKRSCHNGGAFSCSLCSCCRFHSHHAMVCHVTRCHAKMQSADGSTLQKSKTLVDHRVQQLKKIPKMPEKKPNVLPNTNQSQGVFNDGKSCVCDICGKVTRDKWTLREHRMIHTNKKPFKCPICFIGFRTTAILSTHKKTSHGNGKFRCRLCPNTQFTTTKGLSVHKFVYHKGGRQSKYGSQVIVANEEQIQERSIPERAKQVQLNSNLPKSSTKVRLANNQAKFSPKNRPISCTICGVKCMGPTKLREHMISHEVEEELASPNVIYNNLNHQSVLLDIDRDLYDHEGSEMGDEIEEYEQMEEDITYEQYFDDSDINEQDYSEVIEVSETEAEESTFTCDMIEIEDAGSDISVQDEDVLRYDDDMDDQFFDCQGCGLSFSSKAQFLYHIQMNDSGNDDPFKCSLCCSTTATEESLQGHYELYHSQEETEFVESHLLS